MTRKELLYMAAGLLAIGMFLGVAICCGMQMYIGGM